MDAETCVIVGIVIGLQLKDKVVLMAGANHDINAASAKICTAQEPVINRIPPVEEAGGL